MNKRGIGNPNIIVVVLIFWGLMLMLSTLINQTIVSSENMLAQDILKERKTGVIGGTQLLIEVMTFRGENVNLYLGIILDIIFLISLAGMILG